MAPKDLAGLGLGRNQSALGEENHLAHAEDGGENGRGMGHLVAFTLPGDTAVALIEGQERSVVGAAAE